MERKLREIMEKCDLNVFEVINLAIQVASRLYPAELALRRDRIIERLYNSPDVTAHDAARVPGKKARVSAKGGVGSSCHRLITGQGQQGSKQKRSTDAKGKFSKNYTPKIGEIEPRSAPVGTRQGQSSAAAKSKEKIPYSESVPRHAEGSNTRNNHVRSNDMKGKGIAPPTEKVQKHGGMNCNKTLTIGGGEVAQKINNTASGGCQGSSRHDNRDEQDITITDDLIKISKGKEKAEDPLDWWMDEDDSSSSDDI